MSRKYNILDVPLKIRTGAPRNPNHSDFHLENLETAASSADDDAFLIVDSSGRSYQQPRTDLNTGWRDMLATIGAGSRTTNPPTLTSIPGMTSMFSWQFADAIEAQENQVFLEYHVDHDYKRGTDLYLHVHSFISDAGPGQGDLSAPSR